MLDEREVWHIAESVGKWVWRNTTAAGFKEYQSAMGKRSGAARLAKSADQRAEARIMRASGGSTRQIAKDLVYRGTLVRRSRVMHEPYQIAAGSEGVGCPEGVQNQTTGALS